MLMRQYRIVSGRELTGTSIVCTLFSYPKSLSASPNSTEEVCGTVGSLVPCSSSVYGRQATSSTVPWCSTEVVGIHKEVKERQ